MGLISLDTNVVVALFIEDAHSEAAEALLKTQGPNCTISDLVKAEFAGVMGRRFRGGRLTSASAMAAMDDFDLWVSSGVTVAPLVPADFTEAALWLRQIDMALSTPDALHIAIARRLGLTLATFDRGMATAARALGLSVLGA